MRDFGTAMALLLVIEGVAYALFPDGMKKLVAQMLPVPASTLRMLGLVAACAGVGFVWLTRR